MILVQTHALLISSIPEAIVEISLYTLLLQMNLLPDYKKKFKTKVIKDTTNPVWNEKFVFEKLKLDDLRSNRVVELTVWDLVKDTRFHWRPQARTTPTS